MEQSRFSESQRFPASQEIPRILWNPKVHYRIHKGLSQRQSMPPHPTSWRYRLILSSHLRLGLPSSFIPSGFATKILYTPLFSPIPATCAAHFILLDLITRTMLGVRYRLLNSSLCSFFHFSVTTSLLGPNILHNTPFSKTLSLLSSLNVSSQVKSIHQFLSKTHHFVARWSVLCRLFSLSQMAGVWNWNTSTQSGE